jgi:predicted ATPase
MTQNPAAVYQQRCAEFGAQFAQLERRARLNGNLNLLLFFVAFAVLTAAAVRGEALLYWLAAALGGAFVVGVVVFQHLKRQAGRAAALLAINREGLHRLARNWSELPPPPPVGVPGGIPRPAGAVIDPATAADLDLLGPTGLQHLLNTPTTPVGQATLCAWLLQGAAPPTVAARQSAVRELAPLVAFRDEVRARGRQMGAAQPHYERFVAWAEGTPWLLHQPLLLWVARLLPLLTFGLAVGAWFYGDANPPLYWALGAVLALSLALALTAGRRAGDTISQVEAQQDVFEAYAGLFALLATQKFVDPTLERLQAQLAAGTEATRADRQMRRLQRLMPLASIRRWVLFFPIEVVTLWNFHLLWLLERWQVQAGAHVRHWLAVLGEMEALLALATLHFDHPGWNFPQLDDNPAGAGPSVEAANLAHPLLPPDRAVGNDVVVGPRGTFLLVTGSNMSGKSTLLRALGVNCVLAQMGAPVCGDRLRLPPLTIAASMRVQDSLAQGVSYFMAELHGLKAVVDLAENRRTAGTPVLYLLDEILQGTNTAERQLAARHIIRRLVDTGAIGAVSTHDLALAGAPELADAAVAVHFTESFTRGPAGPAMHFDYKLRQGVATSTNALKLMEIVGLR